MTLPDERRKGSPRERFRNILAAEDDEAAAREPRKPAVVNLPKIGQSGPRAKAGPADEASGVPDLSGEPPTRLLPAFWTLGGILSVIANVLLVSMLIGGRGSSGGGVVGVLPGVYASLDQLDNAHIRATIPLRASMALDAAMPVQSSSQITLARDLVVRGAHVTITGSGLSIDSPADITLPAGTEMDVNIDLALPLQGAWPVTADVPVDIPIRDTELHAAIQGLKDSLRPLVCADSPEFALVDGTRVCR